MSKSAMSKAVILKFCREKCTRDTKCKGKLLRKATANRMFVGVVTTNKGSWYCSKL
jgi:hypothetical protein